MLPTIETDRNWYIAPNPTSIEDAVWEKGMDDSRVFVCARCRIPGADLLSL